MLQRLSMAVVAWLTLTVSTGALAAEDILIENVTLIDGTGQKREHMTVGIKDGKFSRVAPTSAASDLVGHRIDGTGKYLIPGLIDVHIHLEGVGEDGKVDRARGISALASYLYSGVTTVYDAGNQADYIMALRADERKGRILAPRILATGSVITYPEGQGSEWGVEISDWPAGQPRMAEYIARLQPDIVKIIYEERGWGSRPMIPMLRPQLMQEIILYANRQGIRTTAHTSSELRAIEAIFAGVDSLAHPVIQGPISDDFAKLMGAKKIPMATTLTIGEGYSRLVEHPEYLDAPLYAASLSAAQIAELRAKTAAEWQARPWTRWMKLMTPIAQENMKKIHVAGGVIAVATDQTIGPAVHREMELLQAAGIPAADIITIATRNGARHLGLEKDLGTIEAGKIADAVLLSEDPTADINNAKLILTVIKAGKLIDEDKLPLAGGKRPLRRDRR